MSAVSQQRLISKVKLPGLKRRDVQLTSRQNVQTTATTSTNPTIVSTTAVLTTNTTCNNPSATTVTTATTKAKGMKMKISGNI